MTLNKQSGTSVFVAADMSEIILTVNQLTGTDASIVRRTIRKNLFRRVYPEEFDWTGNHTFERNIPLFVAINDLPILLNQAP